MGNCGGQHRILAPTHPLLPCSMNTHICVHTHTHLGPLLFPHKMNEQVGESSVTLECFKTFLEKVCTCVPSCCCCCYVASVVSDSARPHRRQPTRLPRPWDSPGKNTGVGCHCLLQCRKEKSESEVAQSCPTLRDPMDCSLPGSSIHGIFQARVLECGAIAFSVCTQMVCP